MSLAALLSTKLLAPAARPDGVARNQLTARLSAGVRSGRQLTLVCAPPGFGKTTLIREWIAAAEGPVAWLTADAGDNDPDRFVRYLAATLRQAITRGAEEPADGPLSGMAEPQDRLIALINEITASGVEMSFVLDDYHMIHTFAVHDLVAFLLAHQPPNLHLVIGTREDPPLPLARLRARDQITEIRERALRFTAEEAAAFLTQTMRLNLTPATITTLAARTEGWITGLQLAGLAIRQRAGESGDPRAAAEFAAAFAGDDRYIVDYLMAEVLQRAPATVRDFLRRTAVLDRLCAPLCNALTGREDAQAMLEQLEAANLFLIPLDNRREWYRYHVLFAEVLRLTLAAAERDDLHRQAARWFQANGWGELAMRHARLVSQTPAATEPAGRRAMGDEELIEPLSEREIEVLRLIAEGCSNAEIGDKLYIAIGTVKRHINNIYGKLGVESRTQAIAKARDLGLL
jgi:LuxR family maltose regulon positive regulatory protein